MKDEFKISKTKELMREEIWNTLEKKGFSDSPKPIHGRIPGFKGAENATALLRNTTEWRISQVIFSSPDSAQIKVREYVLEDGKNLIMATPKLKNGYLLISPRDISGQEKSASTIKGAFKLGKPLQKLPPVDLVVEGSLAVDLSGRRLGKGGGYGDQEIEHLLKENSITSETPIVTTVHEAQIVRKIPREPHDKNINMIVTPQRVLRINRK